MKAVTINGYGGVDRIAVQDVAAPGPPGEGQVALSLRAAALNHLDLFVVGGLPGTTHTFPFILGSDGAGVVSAVGPGVSRLQPGDRVLINPGMWCGVCDFCRLGEHSLCERYRLLGEHVNGALAESLVVPEVNCEKLAEGTSWVEAAAFPLAFLTAWRMLMTKAKLREHETVFIWGIGGGVALASLAIARFAGARTIVTSSSDAKLERAKALGADVTLNHRTQDVVKEVRALTQKRGAQVVVDSVGKDTWERSLRVVARAGRIVTCGGTSGPELLTDVRRLFWHQWTIMGSTMGTRDEFSAVTSLFAQGKLKPVVDRVFPLAEAPQAFRRMEQGGQFGKIVVEIGS